MTRALQDRLALANFKIIRGWQNRSINSIEPELEHELKRKRSGSAGDFFSDTSSSASSRCFSATMPTSSPLTAPVLSDGAFRSGSSRSSTKRRKMQPPLLRTASTSRLDWKDSASNLTTAPTSKSSHQLPESSPVTSHASQLHKLNNQTGSFASETSTILDSASASEDDDQDIPLHSFQFCSDQITSSPPRTPPPDVARSARLRSKSFRTHASDVNQPGKEGADLLMFFASSPCSPQHANKTPMQPPSTPPAKHTPLPSSMMSTPGGSNLMGFGPHTPNGFNFADYLNVTPSPAQAPWSKTPRTPKTPSLLKTPVAARETRRRLNFASPSIGSTGHNSSKKGEGLGMELGGELLS